MKTNTIIFYAEDDRDDQEIFEDVIQEIKYPAEISFQNDGVELLKDLRNKSYLPNLIFLDLNMPGRNGFHVLQEIREMQEFDHIPVIILSTSNDPVATYRAKNLGANLFLNKPATYIQFIALLKTVLYMDWSDLLKSRHPFYINISQTTIVKAS